MHTPTHNSPFAPWPKTTSEQHALLNRLNDIDVVSFDIFDTLLHRPFAKPRHLFQYIELKTGIKNFYTNRIQASRLTRKKQSAAGIEEITLDEIYETLGTLDSTLTPDTLARLKQLEQETEINLCQPNLDTLAFYQLLQQNHKKIVLTSDMYLPVSTIEHMLHKCGYRAYHQLIVSHTDKRTKKSGRRFENFLNLPPHRILHIGDNFVSDVQSPSRYGIHTILYTPTTSPYQSNRLVKRIKKEAGLFFSFWHAQIQHQPMPDYWYSIGFQYIGPLLAHFCHFLNNELNQSGLHHVAFMARDGQIMKRVFDTLFPNEKQTDYVFASRLMMQAALSHSTQTYLNYLNGLHLTNAPFALVDVGRNGTLQNNLKTFFNQNHLDISITGYYIDLRRPDGQMHGYFTKQLKKYKRFLDFLDFLMIADHPLITDIIQNPTGFDPVYLPPDADELKREEIARRMHAGAVDFAQKMLPFKELDAFYLSPNQLIQTLNCFMRFDLMDKHSFAGVTVPFGLQNEKKRYVVPPAFSVKDWITHPLNCFKIYRKSLIK